MVSDKLTLAGGFDLLSTSLKELPAPVAGEVLRQRMIANHGREDALFEVTRFDRLLRQAHDAELVEVRKVGEGMYDVAPLGNTNGPPARYERAPQPSSRPAEAVAPAAPAVAPAAVEIKPDLTGSRSLGARRGTRSGMIKAAVPLVGVISLDDDAPARRGGETPGEPAAEKAPRGRGRAPKPESAPVADGAAPAKKRSRRGGRGRGKGKPKSAE